MNYLSIDYGLKHIGLAIATTPIAEPLQTIPTSQAFNLLPQLIDQHHINHIIIGLPDGPIRDNIHQFVSNLKSQVPALRNPGQGGSIPLIFHDETLSSKEAAHKLRHAKHSTRSGPDHHFAAALILQDYLDHHPTTS